MFERFLQYIKRHKLIDSHDKILLAVSGGIDSVVMCELFHQSGIRFDIAHCNFSLRGEESDGDEQFVRNLAERLNVSVHVKKFDTKSYAQEEGVSIQMAARDLRYLWFKQLALKQGYDKIAIAHNLNDQAETFFINLLRGTGIAGLRAMKPFYEGIIRPLLIFSREEIVSFATDNECSFREDSSNASDKYLRNRIRHHLIPLLKELQPELYPIFSENIERLADTETVYLNEIEQKRQLHMQISDKRHQINIERLNLLNPLPTYLYEFLKPYGFNETIVGQLISVLNDIPGKVFLSSTHRLIKDRESLIIEPLEAGRIENVEVFIEEDTLNMIVPLALEFTTIDRHHFTSFNPSTLIAWLDKDKLTFPLSLHKMQTGDRFRPLGMKGFRKLSDFLTDLKIPLPDKQNTWVVTSGRDIVWVVGHRIDDRFKITAQTKEIFKMIIC
jgi:tRNA(Ile)-lysidine synthase